ncbi:MAG: hypothetical protein ABFS32_13150 [Bacteroidota bacterium]
MVSLGVLCNRNKTVPQIEYYHHFDDDPSVNIEPDEIENINTEEDILALYSKELSCPSNIGGGIDINAEMTIIAIENVQILAYEDTISQVTDGGDTETLNLDVQTSFPDEALEIRQDLLNQSPYLSDTVMKSAINQENVLPNLMLRDILVANPQASKSTSVLDALDNRFIPMPDYMMAEIMQGQNIWGAKELLELELSKHQSNKTKSFNKLTKHYLADTINGWARDSLMTLFNSDIRIFPHYQAAFINLDE